ncbi:MAG: hypothetical protein MI864_21670 [Pseudomonadales bacterium]|uniref:PBP superfamily periplasmic binding protein n=1 Tax=Oleiphilus messinensis TaxID=141451 RepID=A0A1Y0I8D9_9GAMM|nr:hypothetical protein [Oleiphilus messinensis]ARU55755.1 PBP superfamily periplasmic binding protein [Oleiphilus messinensis]MCG8613127.1 hypothetical protein [Pseudomonadales bacterium]
MFRSVLLAGLILFNSLSVNATESVIANSSNAIQFLNLNQVRAIFSLRVRQWDDGTPITVFVLEDRHPAHQTFIRSVLHMLPHQLRRHWDRYIYSGIGQGPITVRDETAMLLRVSNTPGAIGYLPEGISHDQVQIVPIH